MFYKILQLWKYFKKYYSTNDVTYTTQSSIEIKIVVPLKKISFMIDTSKL